VYLYRVGYGSYEDSEYFELMHADKLSCEYLHKVVVQCINGVLKDIISGKIKICLMEDGVSYEDINEDVINKMIQFYGFKKVEYQAKWSVFGWPSITCDKSWGEQRGDVLIRVTEEIPQDIKDKINEMVAGMVEAWKLKPT
jgi:hypothetical protein